MPASIESRLEGDELHISVKGRFDAGAYAAFIQAARTGSGDARHVVVDVSGVDTIDSAGLGMLLIAREAAGANRASIRGCSPDLLRILGLVNFGQLFELC
jgi:HptB-dependent secretion and biofilm anti anti-sigma factor